MAPASQANSGNAPQPPPESPRLEFRDIIRTIQKRRWLIAIVALVVVLAGGIFGTMAPKRYAATAMVLIHTSPPGGSTLNSDNRPAQPEPQVSVATQAQLVATLQNAQKTAELLKQRPGGGLAVSPAVLVRRTEVQVQEPDMLLITVTLPDREAVTPAANTLAEVYVAAARERSRGIYSEAGDVLQEQMDGAQERLNALHQQRLELLERGGAADIALEVKGAQELLAEVRANRDTAYQRLQNVRRSLGPLRRAAAQESPVETLPARRANPQWETMQESLEEKRRQLEAARARYTEAHPLVQNAREEYEALSASAARIPPQLSEQEYAHNPRYDDAQTALRAAEAEEAGLTAEVAALDRSLQDLQRDTKTLPSLQVEDNKLQQQIAAAEEGYRQLVTTLQDHLLRQANRTGVAEVVDQAVGPMPVTAPLIRTLVYSLILGLFCGIALALLLETLDNTIRSPEDVTRQTGLSLLGAIPLLEDTSPQVITLSAPQSPASEAYRTLRSNIAFALTDLPARSFLVAAALGSEGRSSVAANLAVVTAHAGQAVVLVDTDLRKPVLADLFGLNPGLGLTNLLVGDARLDEVLQDTGIPGLYLLASGPLPPNPAELLDSARMTQVIAELHTRADVVVFDSPPALLLADAAILSSKVDRVLLTAESGRVSVDAVREVLRLMYHARASVLGIVLNRYRMPTAGFYQHYYEEPPNRPRPAAPSPEEAPPAA
ncbi:MAG: polysaccharide biosynthesis tyrosine autokinase, partial [Armatimonadetes bacterium]|nr:polysaccharide biosynthesis tyrosine autokinase [Armatimonadota bacterium]